jgi:hypothetical protein
MLIPARSLSLRAARILRPGVGGRVLASFEQACDLVTDAGEVVALVWDGIGNGPLNIVLAHGSGLALPAGTGFAVCGRGEAYQSEPTAADRVSPSEPVRLALDWPANASPLLIDLSTAMPWDPQPDWKLLRASGPQIATGTEMIASILVEAGWSPTRCGLPEALCEGAARGQPAAICAFVGLGPGLTPAGDDWLAGWLLAQHLAPDLTGLRNLSGLIQKVAADRTTTLSHALLACAAAGEADEMWHALLSVLATDPTTSLVHDGLRLPRIVIARRAAAQRSNPSLEVRDCFGAAAPRNDELITELCQSVPAIYRSTEAILSHGATSGAAMLIGFAQGLRCLIPDT